MKFTQISHTDTLIVYGAYTDGGSPIGEVEQERNTDYFNAYALTNKYTRKQIAKAYEQHRASIA